MLWGSAVVISIQMKPHGMVQPITVAVLETFAMTNKDGALHPHAGSHFCKL